MTNINRIRQAMPTFNCESVLITSQVNRLFATGFSSSAGTLFITEKDAWYIVDSRYIEAAESAIKDATVVLIDDSKDRDSFTNDYIKNKIKENGVTSVGFEDSTVSYTEYTKLQKAFGIELTPAQKLITELREIKSPTELDYMIKAQRISEEAFNEVIPFISTEVTEKDIAAELIYRILKKGADDVSFSPIVVSGTNSSRPHGVPGNEKVQKGFLTIDFGASYKGWRSDTTRTLCVGKPDDEMLKVYNTVFNAHDVGINAIHEGAKGFDVDAAARRVIADAGYGEYFGHGLGHAIGLEVHESLRASPLSKDILPAGAVITIEPGIYLPGKFGCRIEDTIHVTKNGFENITKLPKELIVI